MRGRRGIAVEVLLVVVSGSRRLFVEISAGDVTRGALLLWLW